MHVLNTYTSNCHCSIYNDNVIISTVDKTVKVKFTTSQPFTGNERDGVIPVTVVATGRASFPYTVEIRPFAAKLGDYIHVAQPDHDFDNKTLFVTFEPNQKASLQRVVNITVKPDTVGGGKSLEGFKASLHLSSDIECSGIVKGSPSEASILVYG